MGAMKIITVYAILFGTTTLAWVVENLPSERLNWGVIAVVFLSGSVVVAGVAVLIEYFANRPSQEKVERADAIALLSAYIAFVVMGVGVFWWRALATCVLMAMGR